MAVIDADVRLKKFLDLIAYSEGTSTHSLTKNDGYDVLVTSVNGPAIFEDYSKHPFTNKPAALIKTSPTRLLSSAAGRYQLLEHYFIYYQKFLHLTDFSPLSQDIIALHQVRERKAYDLILQDKVEDSIVACCNIWASFPGNTYKQGGKSMQVLLDKYSNL